MATNLPVPLNEDDEANLYDSNEDALNRTLFRMDKDTGGSARISDQLGRVSSGQGRPLLPASHLARRMKIGEHTAQMTKKLADLKQIRDNLGPISDEKKKCMEELEAMEEKLKSQADGNATIDALAQNVEDLLIRHPAVLVRLQTAGLKIGGPGQGEIEEILQNINDTKAKLAVLDERFVQEEKRSLELQRRMEAQEESASHGSSAQDVEKLGIIAELVGVSFGSVSDWPMAILEDAILTARIWETRITTPNAASIWMNSLRMTQPANNGRSAREQALWLLSKVHNKEMDFSLADIHIMVAAMINTPLGVIAEILAFFHQFLLCLVKVVRANYAADMTEEAGCNVHCALILLRSMELLLLHLADRASAYRIESMMIYQEIAPVLVKAAKQSRLVRGFEGLVGSLLTVSQNPSLAGVLLQNETSLSLDNKRLMSTGDDLILIEDNQVHLIRSHKHKLELDILEGIRFVVTGFPSVSDVWRSSFLGFTAGNLGLLQSDFASAMERNANMYEIWKLDARLEAFQIDFE